MSEDIVIVYIGGFLVPKGRMPYDERDVPLNTKILTVYPSGVSSLHDRVMQLFYELKGGLVHYGEEHSSFHGHSPTGVFYDQAKYGQWDECHPIHVVGHSFGGPTARVLHHYLSLGNMFEGYSTNSSWITSVTAVNSPLNGALRVYCYGANVNMPNITRLAN
jgi:triacylglycerol esterase/lipase EstA (alpha/beta hydrolase family)